jgi:long-chain acyl-CoA synthetase
MTARTIHEGILRLASRTPGRAAFSWHDGEWRETTYGQLLRDVQGIAAHLSRSGFGPGSRAAIVSENRPEWAAAYLATALAGGTAVPIDSQLGPRDVEALLTDSEASVLFHSAKLPSSTATPAERISFDSPAFRKIAETPPAFSLPSVGEEDMASLLYTSGTTGNPKGVMLSHKNFCADVEALIGFGLVRPDDNLLSILPFHHTYPFTCTLLLPLFTGATVTFPPSLKGPDLVATLRGRGITLFMAAPQLLELFRNGIYRKLKEAPFPLRLLLPGLASFCGLVRRHTGLNLGKALFPSVRRGFGERLRFLTSGGARLDPRVMEDLEAVGLTVLEGYGLTETSPVDPFNPLEKRKPGSAGKPLPSADLRILDPAETGEGEIAIAGPMVMMGYYRNPEATAEVLNDGWFRTGDLGHLDGDGYLFITGRRKEVIVLASGKNVYPEDVEKEYLKIPLIKEIGVRAAEREGRTEGIDAVIVPDLDVARRERIGNLHAALRDRIQVVSTGLPAFMRIKGFSLSSDPLPRTPLGKLKRYLLSAQASPGTKRAGEVEDDKELLADETGKEAARCILSVLPERRPVLLTSHLELDLGLDSLQRIELVVALEHAFSLRLPETFASEVQTVADLVGRLREARAAGSATAGQPAPVAEPSEMDRKKIGMDQGRLEWAFTLFCMTLLKALFYLFFRLRVRGIENLPEPPFIVSPNHVSHLDAFVVAAALPSSLFRRFHFQGYQTYFTRWPLTLFARLAHVIPIDPETFLREALQISSFLLRNGRTLCIFPEGGRSLDANLMEFKKGVAVLSREGRVPVVPARIEGTLHVLPRGRAWPRPGRIGITFGPPLPWEALARAARSGPVDPDQAFTAALKERIRRMGETGS